MKIKETHGKYTEYILSKTDEKYGNTDKPTVVAIKLASPSDNLSRYRVLQSHFFDSEPLQRAEIFLTLADSNILDDDGEPLFKFNKDSRLIAEEFSENWDKRDLFLFDEIQECVHASNPNWAMEWDLIEEIRLKFNDCMLYLSHIPLMVHSFDPEIEISFKVGIDINGQTSIITIPPI